VVQAEACADAGPRVAAELAEMLGGRIDASLASAFQYVAELLSDRGRRLSPPEAASAGSTIH